MIRPLLLLGPVLLSVPALPCARAQGARGNTPAPSVASPRAVEDPGPPARLDPGFVRRATRLGSVTPGFDDELDARDAFGQAVATIGDLDGDGIPEYAVGSDSAPGPFGTPRGRVWIFFPRADRSIRRYRKISLNEGDFGDHPAGDEFASALAGLGDLDGDGVPDLAVGAPRDPDGGTARGAVWILFLRTDGTVKRRQKISDLEGGFVGQLGNGDFFGSAVATLGDLDGDGIIDLAVGAPGDDARTSPGDVELGTVWILNMRTDGTVRRARKINERLGNFPFDLESFDNFGRSLCALGDWNGDGTPDLAVGSVFYSHQPAQFRSGSVYLLYLTPTSEVLDAREINQLAGGFPGTQENRLGAQSIARVGDLDGDGTEDLAVGSVGVGAGRVQVLFLNPDGTVRDTLAIGDAPGGFGTPLVRAAFGSSIALLGDLDVDGHPELLVGGQTDPDDPVPFEYPVFGGRGAIWTFSMTPDGHSFGERKIGGAGEVIPNGTLDPDDGFGAAAANLGDLDGDGRLELAVGAPGDDAGGLDRGAVWVLTLDAAGNVQRAAKISALFGGFGGALRDGDGFGSALATLGDLDGDGRPELAVGAPGDDDGDRDQGAVWILSLNPDGSVFRQRKISATSGDLGATLLRLDAFGHALAFLGDLGGDGVPVLAVGVPGDTGGGRVLLLRLATDGHVASTLEIADGLGGFPAGLLEERDQLGSGLAVPGDIDQDGVDDLAVGAIGVDRGNDPSVGAVWILFLRPDGSVRALQRIGSASGGFAGTLNRRDLFGASLAALGDLDGNGVPDLGVGAPQSEAADGFDEGGCWILFLTADGTVQGHVRIEEGAAGFDGVLRDTDHFGASLFAGVDLDGDGIRDLLVGAPQGDDGALDEGLLWRLELDGVAVVDFRHADDLGLTPLRNGERLGAPAGFVRTLQLSSYGANLGPAIFDSRPGGPNDPSQDRDLLVGRDHLAILQNDLAPAESEAGVFDHPNDDENGGTIRVRFLAGPVTPLSLDLVDIDAGALQSVQVQLIDTSGRTRTYLVPARWTGDLLVDGPPAVRTLDLTTLLPQPGLGSTATASETSGFDPERVGRIEVLLGSSGALDQLRWFPRPGG